MDWVSTPPVETLLVAARTAIDESVQLYHGCSRVPIGNPRENLYELRGPAREMPDEQRDAAWLAADLHYLALLMHVGWLCRRHDRAREMAWVVSHYATWTHDLRGDHFRVCQEELLAIARRHQAGWAKVEAGAIDTAKLEKNIAALGVLQERSAVLYDHLHAFVPDMIPPDWYPAEAGPADDRRAS